MRASFSVVIVGVVLATTGCAASPDRLAAADVPYSAPLIYEGVGNSTRSCAYRASAEQMNLVIDKVLPCPASVVCKAGRTSTKPMCVSPIKPYKVS